MAGRGVLEKKPDFLGGIWLLAKKIDEHWGVTD
jgi:hypothetical protein